MKRRRCPAGRRSPGAPASGSRRQELHSGTPVRLSGTACCRRRSGATARRRRGRRRRAAAGGAWPQLSSLPSSPSPGVPSVACCARAQRRGKLRFFFSLPCVAKLSSIGQSVRRARWPPRRGHLWSGETNGSGWTRRRMALVGRGDDGPGMHVRMYHPLRRSPSPGQVSACHLSALLCKKPGPNPTLSLLRPNEDHK